MGGPEVGRADLGAGLLPPDVDHLQDPRVSLGKWEPARYLRRLPPASSGSKVSGA